MPIKEDKEFNWKVFKNEYGHIYFRGEIMTGKQKGYTMWLNSCLVDQTDERFTTEQDLEDEYQRGRDINNE